jgi:hypothetical protein
VVNGVNWNLYYQWSLLAKVNELAYLFLNELVWPNMFFEIKTDI